MTILIILKHRLSTSVINSMTAENGALGQGIGQGDEGAWSLPSPALARRAGFVHYNLCYIDPRVLGGAQHQPEKTSRLRASVGGRLLVGLVNPVEGGHDARAVPKFRDRQREKDVDVPFWSTVVLKVGNVGQLFLTIGIQ